MDTLNRDDIKGLFPMLEDTFARKKEYLIELDSIMGDADLGLTMFAAFLAAHKEVETIETQDIGRLFVQAGAAMAKAAPSTMGTLMATGFMRGGKAVKGIHDLGLTDLSLFFDAFVEGLMERGKAKPGDKTVIDSLHPAAQALREAAECGSSLASAFEKALTAAEDGLESTKDMTAQHGRAAYYREKSRDRQDAGAVVGKMIVQTFKEMIDSKETRGDHT